MPGQPARPSRRAPPLGNAVAGRLVLAVMALAAGSPAARASVMANAFSYTYSPYRASQDNTVTGASSVSSVDPYGFSSASVDQATGTMHLSSHGQSGVATVEIDEKLTPGYTGTFTYTFELTGSIQVSPVPAPYLDATGYSMQFAVGAQACGRTYVQNATAASGPVDRYLTGTCSVTKGYPVSLKISAGVVTSGKVSSADFANTGIFHIDVPDGQSLGYADADFLSDPQPFETTAVPEPATAAVLGTGLALATWARRRRTHAGAPCRGNRA